MHIDEAKGRLKLDFRRLFILKVFRRRLRLSESWKQWFEQQKTRACVPHTPYTSVLKLCHSQVGVWRSHARGWSCRLACYPSGLKFMPPAGRVWHSHARGWSCRLRLAIVDAATSADDFLLTDVRKQKMTIYIGIQPNKLAEARLIINLFFSQLINLNTKELPQSNKELRYQCLY